MEASFVPTVDPVAPSTEFVGASPSPVEESSAHVVDRDWNSAFQAALEEPGHSLEKYANLGAAPSSIFLYVRLMHE